MSVWLPDEATAISVYTAVTDWFL